jgi:hypothetical protein
LDKKKDKQQSRLKIRVPLLNDATEFAALGCSVALLRISKGYKAQDQA